MSTHSSSRHFNQSQVDLPRHLHLHLVRPTSTFTCPNVVPKKKMSRVTPPVTKLTSALRSISTSASRSSNVAGESRHVSIYLPRKVSDLRAECNRRQLKSRGSKLEVFHPLTSLSESPTNTTHPARRQAYRARCYGFPRLPHLWRSSPNEHTTITYPHYPSDARIQNIGPEGSSPRPLYH